MAYGRRGETATSRRARRSISAAQIALRTHGGQAWAASDGAPRANVFDGERHR
jgi:hypothetical protein